MSTLQYVKKITRFDLALFAGISTWVIAILSNSSDWSATINITTPIVMTLGILGASLYHFGAANPMYTRKSEILSIGSFFRAILIGLGLLAMFIAVYITYIYLNVFCQAIVFLDAAIIVLYASILSRHWFTKNLLMAFVCISPILLGWFAGERLHPLVPYGIAITFFAYLGREIVKDTQDIKANQGHRITLPIWLGTVCTRRITAAIMLIALAILAMFGIMLMGYNGYIVFPYIAVWVYWLKATYSLAFRLGKTEEKESKQILLGSACLMLTFLMLIF